MYDAIDTSEWEKVIHPYEQNYVYTRGWRKLVPAENPVGWIYLINAEHTYSTCFIPFPKDYQTVDFDKFPLKFDKIAEQVNS